MAMTTGQFGDLLDIRFREVTDGRLEAQTDRIPEFYDVVGSDLEIERGSSLTDMGLFQDFTSDNQLTYDQPSQGYDWSATHNEYALGVQIQRRLWRFDQFNVIEGSWKALIDSALKTRQIHAAKMFNEGFDVSSLINFTHSRGESLFADAHATTVSGVSTASGFDNKFASALSATSLQSIRILIKNFKSDAGYTIGGDLDDLILLHPVELHDAAQVALKSAGVTGSMDNDINTVKGMATAVEWNRLTDSNNYFVLSKSAMKDNFCWFEADPLETNQVLDFDTWVAKYSAYMQHTTAWKDWRVGVGAEVS